MDNKKMILVNGVKVPVSKVKHWRLQPDDFIPTRCNVEATQWRLLNEVKLGWEQMDASRIFDVLDEEFSYGSYWVKENLNLQGYKDYLEKKFDTIVKNKSIPKVDIVVLYEALTPGGFPYALRLIQGEVVTLLTFSVSIKSVTSLYMTDPDIYTYEPTFAKGGILGANGEPLAFKHKCTAEDAGREMTNEELQAFAVDCIASLFRGANANIANINAGLYGGFPNIVTKSGADTFYHRIDVAQFPITESIDKDKKELIDIARDNEAWPMIMTVSLFCIESDGGTPLCGSSFFLKALESRPLI